MNHIERMKRRLLARSKMKKEFEKHTVVETKEEKKRRNHSVALLLDRIGRELSPP